MATIKFKRGGATPTGLGLTAGEAAWKYSTNQLYVGVTSDPPIWIGAQIEDSPTWANGSTMMLATQNAINTQFMPKSGGTFTGIVRLQNQIGICFGDADSTNYIGIRAPTTVATNYTLTLPDNDGDSGYVLSTDGSGVLSWIATGAATSVSITDSNADDRTIYLAGATSAGSRTLYIDTTGLTYNSSTNLLANNGGLNLGGNLNVAGTSTLTGNVTASGDLTVTGSLTVNGTTTTVNSNTMTVDDPLIVLGTSGGVAISASDSAKDRGVVFTYFDTAGRTGFFGFDASTSRFTYVAIGATVTNEIISGGTAGDAQFRSLYLTMPSGAFVGGLTLTALAANRTYTLPDHTGSVVVPSDLGTSDYILKSNGTTSQPTWINANAAGFTAYAAGRLTNNPKIALSGDVTATGVTFDGTSNITINTTIAANSVELGTDTTGQYARTIASTGSGLSITTAELTDGTDYTISLAKINSGIDFGPFAFTTGEFTNNGSGTVAIGIVDGGSY
jgi:hypothetical protein